MLPQLNHLMDNKIYLYGASGHGKVVIDILRENQESIGAIIDDDLAKKELLGIAVIHSDTFVRDDSQKWIVAIGNNLIRKGVVDKIDSFFHSAIHPKCIISFYSSIGEGTVVMPAVVINAGVSIGKHCIINTASVIEHDCLVEDFVHISPNATLSGAVTVKEGAHIGAGASIIQGVTIGKWSTIGAGTVIIRDVPDYAVVVGNPGRILKINEK